MVVAQSAYRGTVLVTGADGFIGGAVSAALEHAGIAVVRGTRRPLPGDATGAHWKRYGPIDGATDWSASLAGISCVVHAAGPPAGHDARLLEEVHAAGTARLAQSAAALGVKRIVHIGTALVHGPSSGAQPLTETAPLVPADAYARAKLAAEHRLREVAAATGLETVILRPPLVYGPRAKGNFARLLHMVARGVPLPLGCATAPRSFLAVDNLADATVRCVHDARATGHTFLLCDAEASSTADLVQRLAQALGRRTINLAVPPLLVGAALSAIGRGRDFERLFAPFAFEARHIGRQLGWAPPLSLAEGIRRAVTGLRTRG